jgi:hypothetical protein
MLVVCREVRGYADRRLGERNAVVLASHGSLIGYGQAQCYRTGLNPVNYAEAPAETPMQDRSAFWLF